MISQYDHLEGPCFQLGHIVTFAYCRSTAGKQPCRRLFDCWFQRFPVQEFMQEHLDAEEPAELLRPAPPKLFSLLEMIERARRLQSADASETAKE